MPRVNWSAFGDLRPPAEPGRWPTRTGRPEADGFEQGRQDAHEQVGEVGGGKDQAKA